MLPLTLYAVVASSNTRDWETVLATADAHQALTTFEVMTRLVDGVALYAYEGHEFGCVLRVDKGGWRTRMTELEPVAA